VCGQMFVFWVPITCVNCSERSNHLNRRTARSALLQAYEVVHRDSGEGGQLLPPKPDRPAGDTALLVPPSNVPW
jgi:hypothetical protein